MACRFKSITNNVAQTLNTDSVVSLGQVSPYNTGGQTLTITCSGLYYIDVQVIATPTASSTATLAININGVSMSSSSITTAATPAEQVFEIRGIFRLTKGDIITIVNSGAATLTLTAPTSTNSYNVSTIINRLSN